MHMKKNITQDSQQEEKRRAPRKFKPEVERTKRGRGITLLILILSVLLSFLVALLNR